MWANLQRPSITSSHLQWPRRVLLVLVQQPQQVVGRKKAPDLQKKEDSQCKVHAQ